MADANRTGLIALERALGASVVATAADHCARYARDESEADTVVPLAVVHASSASDIARALAVCNEHGIAVFPRAAGTGRTGAAAVTRPGVVIDCTALDRVKDLDRANHTCVVEPGVITAKLDRLAQTEGLFYPPDPSSLEECTLGGNAATNAGGPRAFKYGVTRDYVLGFEAVTMDGTHLRVGKRTVKGVTGYDLTALLVGSEGTLAVFTEITLRLTPTPPEVRTLVAFFADVFGAGAAVSRIVARGLVPRCLEMLDGECCRAVREQGGVSLPEGTGALLLIEVDGEGSGLDAQIQRVGDACVACGAIRTEVARDETDRAKLWAARRVMSRALRARARFKLSEDVVVPRSRLADMLARIAQIADAERVRLPAYGHAGDGNLHVNFLWDDPGDRPRVDRAIDAVFRATVDFGGTLTGEHGLGVLKAPWLPLEQSEAVIDMQRRIKSLFDPRGLLNPGKMFPAPGGHRAC
jgi:glycolate oxidase